MAKGTPSPMERLRNEMEAKRQQSLNTVAAAVAVETSPTPDDSGAIMTFVAPTMTKRDSKRAVNYYLRESTIRRIKKAAQRYDLKDSVFLDELLAKVLDTMKL